MKTALTLLLVSAGMAIAGTLMPSPASAQVTNQSDVSGTNVFNSPTFSSVLAQPTPPAALSAIQSFQSSLSNLLSTGAVSPTTQGALTPLLQNLNSDGIKNGDFTSLDQQIQKLAELLAKDLGDAQKECSSNTANSGDACRRLRMMVDQTGTLLDSLERLRSVLIQRQKEARLF